MAQIIGEGTLVLAEDKTPDKTEALRSLFEKLDEGFIPSKIFNDPEIYELEKERVFGRAWVYMGHESEIPKPGDYVLRYICDDSFIVVRDEYRVVRVLFNSCRHRGMQVCQAEMGNASHFRCPYHGWTYKNSGDLIGVPFGKEIYGDDGLDKSKWGLRPAPRIEIYNQMIFANLDPDAPSLEEYLGGMKWYLDLLTNRSDEGLEVIGAPQRWVVDADWKLGADNFIGDGYHTSVSHRSTVDVGLLAAKNADFLKDGIQVYSDSGGMGFGKIPPGTPPYPEHIVESFKRNLAPEQADLLINGIELGLYRLSHGTVFPNLSYLPAATVLGPGQPPVPYITFRLWQPIGAGKMEICSWFLVEKNAPEEYKERSRKAYTLAFGTSGTLEQDDTENWRSITRVSKGMMARDHDLNYTMGMNTGVEPLPDWPGPGVAYPVDYIEANERAFMRKWLQYMTQDQ